MQLNKHIYMLWNGNTSDYLMDELILLKYKRCASKINSIEYTELTDRLVFERSNCETGIVFPCKLSNVFVFRK